jgi:hypothetical protein
MWGEGSRFLGFGPGAASGRLANSKKVRNAEPGTSTLMRNRMPTTAIGRPLLLDADLNGIEIERVPLTSDMAESWLQQLVGKNPNIIPASAIDDRVETPLFSIGREIATPVGPIDNLLISRNGYVVVVETKLWRNPEARRAVVAQTLDYAAQIRTWRYADLEAALQAAHPDASLFELVAPEMDEAEWFDQVNSLLENGRMCLAIIGDGIRTQTHTLASALGAHPDFAYRLGLVELRIFEHEGQRIVVPVTALRTTEVERAVVTITNSASPGVTVKVELPQEEAVASRKRGKALSRAALLEKIPDHVGRGVAARLLDVLSERGIGGDWREASYSVRVPDPLGSEKMLSILVITNRGQLMANYTWLQAQLRTAWGSAAAADEGVAALVRALTDIGVGRVSDQEFKGDLAGFAGREAALVERLKALVDEIAEIGRRGDSSALISL